jgi:hypothetical protein
MRKEELSEPRMKHGLSRIFLRDGVFVLSAPSAKSAVVFRELARAAMKCIVELPMGWPQETQSATNSVS